MLVLILKIVKAQVIVIVSYFVIVIAQLESHTQRFGGAQDIFNHYITISYLVTESFTWSLIVIFVQQNSYK